ncbi:PQQ-binding-like beta-propeller repeat protein [Kitasatospora sp. MAP12-44]|uniref:outer membrane protein assembly factor BamB family protein n=2 Tax=unclassified Kitasatospora TaxID=2633591 RepID=UPI0032AED6F4
MCVRDREQVWGFAADASTLVLWRGKRDEDELPARITAVDLQDGSELWHREFRDVGSVLLTGGRVIATTEGRKHRRTRAFDARTGEELWRSEPDAYSGAFLTAAEAGRDGDGQQSFVLAWNRHDDRLQWFSAATGEAAGALTIRPRWQRYRSYEATVADGGRTVWFSAPGARSVHRVRPFESPMLTQTLHTVRPLPYAADPVTVIDGWIYPLRRRGRLSAAKVGGSRRHRWLAPLRLPWGIPLGERFVKTYVTLLEGGNHCYAVRVSRRGQRLLVIRRGRVLWSRPLPGDLVATGDHLLVIGQGDDHDHLWLVDGETGAFTGPSPWPDAA